MIRLRHLAAALLALSALNGCGSNGESANPPSGGLQANAGDGSVVVTWTDDLSVDYWLFVSTDPTLTTQNFSTLTDVRIIRGARSPYVLCGYPDGRTLYLAMNGRTGGGPGGPGTPTINATLRVAGNTWTPGTPLATDFNSVGYSPITSCLSTGRPTGIFVAVGPNGAIASSTDGVTFTARSAPAGFTSDLNAVASFTQSINVPTNPGLKILAVGAGCATLVSTDGETWTTGFAFDPTLPTLRGIAINGSTFIAVGDNGMIRTSTDGITWDTHASPTAANLQGIGCNGNMCLAVGDNGALLRTLDNGQTWTIQPINGLPQLKRVVYGNFNNNLGTTTTALNTWVIVGDAGTVLYSTDLGLTWTANLVAGAANFTGVSYITRFVAVDSAGNSFASVDGVAWSAAVPTGIASPRGLTNNGFSYVTVGTGGATAASF
jgi:hypothetical protein